MSEVERKLLLMLAQDRLLQLDSYSTGWPHQAFVYELRELIDKLREEITTDTTNRAYLPLSAKPIT